MRKNYCHTNACLILIASLMLLNLLFCIDSSAQLKSDELNSIIFDGFDYKLSLLPKTNEAERQYIYMFNNQTNSIKKVTTKFKGVNPKFSPNGKYISFFGTKNVKKSIVTKNGISNDLNFLLFDSQGIFLKSFDIRPSAYEWSPAEDEVVYSINGVEEEMAELPNLISIWILDIATGTRTKIFDRGYYFTWASFDGNIYIDNIDTVYKYDVHTRSISPTKYKDIKFSNDGSYYYVHSSEDTGIVLYTRKNNKDITERLEKCFYKYFDSESSGRMYFFYYCYGWLEESKLLFFDDRVNKSYVYNVKTNAVTNSFDGFLLGFVGTNKQKAVTIFNEKVHVKTVAKKK